MKGVLLAGGTGSRLAPLTSVTSKHLLPIYDRPMIEYPLRTIVECGIKDVCVVLDTSMCGAYAEYLGDGSAFGCNLCYVIQAKPGGIPSASACVHPFVGNEPLLVVLGDNLLSYSAPVRMAIERYERTLCVGTMPAAVIVVKRVPNASDYGVAVVDDNGCVSTLVEKPTQPISDLAVTGHYVLPNDCFKRIEKLKPSRRDETEIVGLLNGYVAEDRLRMVDMGEVEWEDAGRDLDALLDVQLRVRDWKHKEESP